jgi:prephenate dehydratase
MTIGVSGAPGSFSEQAGRQHAKNIGELDAEIKFLISVEGVLQALEDGAIDIGVFPIENSNGGIVIEAVHAMAKHVFSVEKMFEIDVHQNLLAKKGAKTSDINKIVSHDQALKQCRMYIKREWPGVEIEEYADTAKAAADLASGVLPATTAVVAARSCAEIYDLELLEESIQDLKYNYTMFVVAKK